jgi:F-type H+-transporting ATPase subunit b
MDLDITLIIQAVIVLVVLATIGPVLLNPMLAVLDLREKSIAGARHEGAQLLADTAAKEKQLEEKLEAARRQALAERQKLIGEAKDAERQLLDRARAEAQTSLESARGKLRQSQQTAKTSLEGNAKGLAQQIASKILSREIA